MTCYYDLLWIFIKKELVVVHQSKLWLQISNAVLSEWVVQEHNDTFILAYHISHYILSSTSFSDKNDVY